MLVLLGTAAALCLLLRPLPVEAAPAPTIAGISPPTGPLVGGTAATITGTGFDLGGVTVDFGGEPGIVTAVTATSIEVTTPAHDPGPVIVTVMNTDGQAATISGAFRYLGPPPTLAQISPATGPTTGATTVTLIGTNFAAGATVTIGGRAAPGVTVTNSTTATAVTPWGVVGAEDVVFTNADGQSASLVDEYTYTQAPPPTIASVSPSNGTNGGGTQVTITGTGFAPGATVRFGNSAATGVTVVNATTLRVASAPGTVGQTVAVRVTNPDSQTATRAAAFTYVNAPAPTAISSSPTSGPQAGGTIVTILGTNFLPGLTVNFGSAPGTVVSVASNSITVMSPAAASATKVDVTVVNPDGKSSRLAGAFNYTKPPTLTKVAPDSGSTAGGTSITITGTGFVEGMDVLLNGVHATDIEVKSASSATALTPPGYLGAATVLVRLPDGQAASLPAAFVYQAPPRVTSVTPVTGPDTGGTSLVILGSGFGAGARVFLGEVEATEVAVESATRITAVAPEAELTSSVGPVRVIVVMPEDLASVDEVYFIYRSTSGRITAGAIPASGFGLIVFSGGPTSMLVATAAANGCADTDRLSFFASDGNGTFVSYIVAAPPFVNAAWFALFPRGLPVNQPLVARCA